MVRENSSDTDRLRWWRRLGRLTGIAGSVRVGAGRRGCRRQLQRALQLRCEGAALEGRTGKGRHARPRPSWTAAGVPKL